MKIHLNLATRPYINRRRLMICYLVVALILTVCTLLLASQILQSRRQTAEVKIRMAELQKRVGSDRPQAGSVPFTPAAKAELDRSIVAANVLLERDHFHWTQLLDQLEEVTLTGISIHGLQPEFKSGLVKITGSASDLVRLRQFIDRLTLSPNFHEVLLLQQARNKEAGNTVTFSLTLKRGKSA